MEKLIRDNIIDIALSKWEKLIYRIVTSTQEKIFFLIEKLDEELMEFSEANSIKEKNEEAWDVLEVLDSLIQIWVSKEKYIKIKQDFIYRCDYQSLNIETILETQKQKKEEKWWFEKGIILIF